MYVVFVILCDEFAIGDRIATFSHSPTSVNWVFFLGGGEREFSGHSTPETTGMNLERDVRYSVPIFVVHSVDKRPCRSLKCAAAGSDAEESVGGKVTKTCHTPRRPSHIGAVWFILVLLSRYYLYCYPNETIRNSFIILMTSAPIVGKGRVSAIFFLPPPLDGVRRNWGHTHNYLLLFDGRAFYYCRDDWKMLPLLS